MSDDKDYEKHLEEMATKPNKDIMAVLDSDEFWSGLDDRIAAYQAEETAKFEAFKESGKFDVVITYIREQFTNGKCLIWDEDIAYSQEPLPFDNNDFRYTLDQLIENVEREEVEDAMFETYHWSCGEFLVEEMSGQGTLYGIMPIADKVHRLAHITREWEPEDEE